MSRFDALIIGGGPAGSAAAILLAEAGWSVALVEQKQFPRRKVCGEYLSATNWPLLTRLGIAEAFVNHAGPPVINTAIFAGTREYRAALPRVAGSNCWGRALPREHLDTWLVSRSASLGVTVFQPARCVKFATTTESSLATIESRSEGRVTQIAAGVVIAAHGSWETGDLATQRQDRLAAKKRLAGI